MPRLLAVLALMLVVTAAEAAPNPHLARARAELDGLKFEEARSSLKAALRAGDSTPDETAEIYLLTGQVSAALGDTAGAEDAFRRLLALRPAARLPDGTSPKISAPFNAAQTKARGAAPLSLDTRVEGAWPVTVEVTVESDPLNMVAGATVRWGSEKVTAKGTGRISVKLAGDAPSGPVEGTVALVDQHGNALVEQPGVALWSPGADAAVAPGGEVTEDVARPFYARSYTWAAVSLGLATVGGYFAIKASRTQDELDEINANSAMHDFSEALAVQERGEQEALTANLFFAGAGVFAVVTTILIIRDLREPEETTITPTAWSGGGGLVVTGTF